MERHEPPNPAEAAVDLSTLAQQSRDCQRAQARERKWAARKTTLTLVIAALALAVSVYQSVRPGAPRPCSAVVADMLQLRSAKADGLIVNDRYIEALAVLRRQEAECRWH